MRQVVYSPAADRLVYLHRQATPQYWDAHWRAQGTPPAVSPRDDVLVVTRTHLPAGARVLEGGCGRADKVKALADAGFAAVGVDFAADVVARAREHYPQLDVRQGDVRSLDFPDAVLERLDAVLAALDDPAGQSGSQLTDRYVRAMRHPLVQIVTHPTNRLVPQRDGAPLDEPRLFEAAVETGTILEIDGAPGHLDMDGAMARRAIAAGASVSVDGDCHRSDLLGRHMLFAVGTARRGWVQARDVVNALPLDALRRRLTQKRRAS